MIRHNKIAHSRASQTLTQLAYCSSQSLTNCFVPLELSVPALSNTTPAGRCTGVTGFLTFFLMDAQEVAILTPRAHQNAIKTTACKLQ